MNHNGAPTGHEPTITKSFSRLAHDVIELSELQARLLTLDAQALSRSLLLSLCLAAVAILLSVGAIPIALLALAEVLISNYSWPREAALATTAVFAIATSCMLLAIIWRSLSRGVATFERSRDELKRNLAWIKSALRSHAPRNRNVDRDI
jgi:uncharacterized membrane protein YqjE